MRLLGTDHVLNLRTIKKHYDALGSYLHTPTLAQIEQSKSHDYAKLRRRCKQIIDALETALSSTVWNSTLAIRGKIECLECSAVITRRLPKDSSERTVQCWSCPASYNMIETSNNQVRFEPRQQLVKCPSVGCEKVYHIWERSIEHGQYWTCEGCQSKLTFVLGVSATETASEADADIENGNADVI